MTPSRFAALRPIVASLCIAVLPTWATAQETGKGATTLELGKWKVTAPAGWVKQQPKSRITAYEFSVPPVEGEKENGRITVTSSGGAFEANMDRWYQQFTQPDGSPTRDRAKIEKVSIAGQEVHKVQIAGNFRDPFNPDLKGDDFRLLGAIIVTEETNFFIKFTGPRKTVASQEKAFFDMVGGLTRK